MSTSEFASIAARRARAALVVLALFVVATACGSDTPATPSSLPAPLPFDIIDVPELPALMRVGDSLLAIATPRDTAGNAVTGWSLTWASSDPTVATVNARGMIIAVGAGSAAITANASGRYGGGTVTVYAPTVTSIQLTPSADTMLTYQIATLSLTARDQAGRLIAKPSGIVWSSSDRTVAVVDSAGSVTGVSPGSVVITATIGGVSGSAAITVLFAPAPAVIDGAWTMTLSASPSCRDNLPAIARERHYQMHFTQHGATFGLTISGPTLLVESGQDGGRLNGTDISFVFFGETSYDSWTSTYLHDHLSGTETLDFYGAVKGVVSDSVITATMSGDMEYWTGPPSLNGPTVVCRAADHVVTLHR